ncbi:MAG: hypothetical protein LC643_07015 [Bacteroidales bacterium]|nr:hypothetical protein [Bacteroidales bacterium]
MSKTRQLSSNLTLTYKYIVPLMPVAQAGFINIFLRKGPSPAFLTPVNYFFAAAFFILFVALRGLKKVEYNQDRLIVSNYLKKIEYDLDCVVNIKRWFFYFYIISLEMENGVKKIQFMPRMSERIVRPFKKLDSISAFENRVQTVK